MAMQAAMQMPNGWIQVDLRGHLRLTEDMDNLNTGSLLTLGQFPSPIIMSTQHKTLQGHERGEGQGTEELDMQSQA